MHANRLLTYILCLHLADTNDCYMCMDLEGIEGRGGNEVASCFFKVVTSGVIVKKILVLWCDNCVAQNKNRIVLMAIIYLSLELKYLVSGYSFMDCDGDCGVIEKRCKVSNRVVPKELEDIVKSARVNTTFHVLSMLADDLINFAH
ncbi:hypothetical protein PR048_015239 [Dryococelus australis]|uniref:DUF7869 domain-containing protein n=1 Tax=Dryococelus australis TaxID=614101 RepID=A0ABQ9HGF1_9NEOP|nr:hypothetical protein PR048_015239 [Dryococelus australis]